MPAVPYFFEEMAAGVSEQTPSKLMSARKLPAIEQEKDPMARRETLELVRAYYQIKDPIVRKRIVELARAVSRSSDE